MNYSGLVSTLILLVIFTCLESKAVSNRQKRAPGFQQPRLGRRSDKMVPVQWFKIQGRRFQQPRLGGKRSSPSFMSSSSSNQYSAPLDFTSVQDVAALESLSPAQRQQFLRLFVDLLSSSAGNPQNRLDQNYFAYPRSGRSHPMYSNREIRAMLYYPRLGRSGPSQDFACCKGIKSIDYDADTLEICKTSECCPGLHDMRYFSEESGIGISLCLNQPLIKYDGAKTDLA